MAALEAEAAAGAREWLEEALEGFSIDDHPLTRFSTGQKSEHVGDAYFLERNYQLALENYLSDLADDQNREIYVLDAWAGTALVSSSRPCVKMPAVSSRPSTRRTGAGFMPGFRARRESRGHLAGAGVPQAHDPVRRRR